MLLAACSDDGDPAVGEPSTVTAGPAGHPDLAALARSLGIEDPPDVPVVQEISAEQHIPMLESCMTEAGFPPVNPGRPSLEWEPAEEQQEAFHRAYYTCSAQYPIAGEFQPYDGDQLGALYDYWVDETIPCLAALGYETSGIPSREAFIGGAIWDPRESTYQEVARDVSNGRWIDEEDVYSTECPTNPACCIVPVEHAFAAPSKSCPGKVTSVFGFYTRPSLGHPGAAHAGRERGHGLVT